MKKLILFFVLLTSCGNDKIYNKKLHDDRINVDWYHYSYISSSSPNYITVDKGDNEQLIFESGYGLQDIELRNDTIIIYHLEFQVKPKIRKDKVFDCVIKYKEVTSYEVYQKQSSKNKP